MTIDEAGETAICRGVLRSDRIACDPCPALPSVLAFGRETPTGKLFSSGSLRPRNIRDSRHLPPSREVITDCMVILYGDNPAAELGLPGTRGTPIIPGPQLRRLFLNVFVLSVCTGRLARARDDRERQACLTARTP